MATEEQLAFARKRAYQTAGADPVKAEAAYQEASAEAEEVGLEDPTEALRSALQACEVEDAREQAALSRYERLVAKAEADASTDSDPEAGSESESGIDLRRVRRALTIALVVAVVLIVIIVLINAMGGDTTTVHELIDRPLDATSVPPAP